MADKKKQKIINTLGKRKSAVARAVARPGKGTVRVNSFPVHTVRNEIARLKMMEPLILAGDSAKKVDIWVSVQGGGVIGQAEASRQAIAGALIAFDRKLKKVFLEYDRSMLVADPRRNEPHKPSRSGKGPRVHKQRSKR